MLSNLLRSAYLRLATPPDPFLFDSRLDHLVSDLCGRLGGSEMALNLGSGSTSFGDRVINLDLMPFPGVQVCGNAQCLPFKSKAFQGALMKGVLEHVGAAEATMNEIERVLAPGAFLYVEVPFLQPFHASPEDHRRFTLSGLRHFLGDFEEIDSGVQIGPGSTTAWILRETVASIFSFGSPWMYRKLLTLVGWATFWIKYADRIVPRASYVANAASAIYFLGRKRRAGESVGQSRRDGVASNLGR